MTPAPADPPPPRQAFRRRAAVVGFAWLAAMAVGFGLLAAHAGTPGPVAPAHLTPADLLARLHADPARPHLLIAIHPACPCTQASVDELLAVYAATPHRPLAHALIVLPEGAPADWPQTPVVRQLADAGFHIHLDHRARLTTALGATTSGHVLLLTPSRGATPAPQPTLTFSGGVTAWRAHRGPSAGQARLAELITQASTPSDPPATPGNTFTTAVFGCPLNNPAVP